MMKIYFGGIATETNMFCPFPTGQEAWDIKSPVGEEINVGGGKRTSYPTKLSAACQSGGHALHVGFRAGAQPAGLTPRLVYESLRDHLLTDLESSMPFDVVILSLHGAMMASGCDDCEADVIRRVREIVGAKVIIGVLLDPHCHLSETMVDQADVILCYREYPHIDIDDRLLELFQLACDAARGQVKPVSSVYDCRMIDGYLTNMEPMKSFVSRMKEAEQAVDVLSISLVHGFPWADTPDLGSKILVITDGNKPLGDALASEFGNDLFSLRGTTSPKGLSLGAAIEMVKTSGETPLVFGDVSDVPGGGAPSDCTVMLDAFLNAGITNSFFALLFDPGAVDICKAAGEGAELRLRIGGKICWASGQPLDLDVTVKKINLNTGENVDENWYQSFGDAVLVETQGNYVVLNNIRTQPRGLETVSQFGIDPGGLTAIVLKSMTHFQANFRDIASFMGVVMSEGLLNTDFKSLPYRRLKRPKWPLDEDPFGQSSEVTL